MNPDGVTNVVTEVITIDDPVTGQSVTISIAGVAEVIGAFYCKWYKDDRDAEAARAATALADGK